MIETRKSEVRYFTSNPEKMLGKYTTSRVYKTYSEDFYDKEKDSVEKVERHQLLLDKGVYINNDVLAEIKFWLAEGTISEIEVSSQKRMSYEVENDRMYPYKAVVSIDKKRHSFIFYAYSMKNAIEILNDYVELNFFGGFTIVDLKELDYCVILVDKFKTIQQRNLELDITYLNDDISMEEYIESKIDESVKDTSENEEENDDALKLKFYQIGAKIIQRLDDESSNDEEFSQVFIVRTFSAVRANLIIAKWLQDEQEKRYMESLLHPERNFVKKQIMSFIEESKILSIGNFIPRQFTEAYQNDSL